MDSLLRLLMGPWTTYIIYVLRTNGPTRFGELKRKVTGVSAKVLTERLRMRGRRKNSCTCKCSSRCNNGAALSCPL